MVNATRIPRSPMLLSFCALSLILVTGCGPGRGDLKGNVSYRGKSVASGSVVVAGADGIPKGGEIKEDGSYVVTDIAVGEVKITVNSPDPGKVKFNPRKKDEKAPPPKDRSKWFAIPESYSSFEKSNLRFDLKSGSNNLYDLELK